MKRLLLLLLFCSAVIITSFLLFEDLEKWIAANLHTNTSLFTYTLLSFIFLSLDTLLPIPSSLLMILNGKVLGPFFGTILSFIAGLLSSVFGFYLGRKANPFLNKFFSPRDITFSNTFFQRFGNGAILLSKALPVLSEAISFVAGTTSISFKIFLIYSIPGHLVVAIMYGYWGSFLNTLPSGLIVILLLIGTVLLGWVVQVLVKKM